MEEPETEPALPQPPGGPSPPAPPATGDPAGGPDPSDPEPPIIVQLGEQRLGDLGNARVDARLLSAILTRDGHVAAWLRAHEIDLDGLEHAFPDSRW
jgi:hypothetical protein